MASKQNNQETRKQEAKMNESSWKSKMKEKVNQSLEKLKTRDRIRNPLIPVDLMDLAASGLPSDYRYVFVPVPSNPVETVNLKKHTQGSVQYHYLDADVLDDPDVHIPGAENFEGVVVVDNCYLMYTLKEVYESERKRRVNLSNQMLQERLPNAIRELNESAGGPEPAFADATSQRRNTTLGELIKESDDSDDFPGEKWRTENPPPA